MHNNIFSQLVISFINRFVLKGEFMLTENQPNEAVVDWAESCKLVQYAKDRPWYYAPPPHVSSEEYQLVCRCNILVKLISYACENGVGYIYVGQCKHCQIIMWSFLECEGKNG